MKDKLFWVVITLSSFGAAIFGYHRFKQIRPDLFPEERPPSGISESERSARIADYQQKGDGLSRAARVPASRKLQTGETCQNGFIARFERTTKESDNLLPVQVVENGKPVRCDTDTPQSPQ